MRNRAAPWLVVGAVLMVGGPLAPAWWGGRQQAVALVDLGQHGGTTVLTEADVDVAAPGWARRRVAPGVVEVRAPAADLAAMSSLQQRLARPAAVAVPCDQPACTWEALPSSSMFNRQAGLLDPPAVQSVAASRVAWLLGMAVGLLGLALLVMGAARRQTPVVRGWAPVVAGALAAGIGGAAVGSVLSRNHQQVLLIKPGQRPRLPSEAVTRDAVEHTHQAVARLESPGFSAGLPVTVHAMPMGNGLLAYVETPDPLALPAFADRVQRRLLDPVQAATLDVRQRLSHDGVADLEPHRIRILGELQDVVLTPEPSEPDPRSPLVSGLLSALAGALLAWAARGNGRHAP